MPPPSDSQRPIESRDAEASTWPLLVALAVIGPLAFGVAIALLVAIAR